MFNYLNDEATIGEVYNFDIDNNKLLFLIDFQEGYLRNITKEVK